jgi:glucosyl-dolichyl phosphate glucuronosyltransferase
VLVAKVGSTTAQIIIIQRVGMTIMTATVIIATKDRSATLVGALESILRQTLLPDELVVVDQSKGGETKAAVMAVTWELESMGQAKPTIVYILDRDLPGAGAARNVGIKQACGDILVFLDDDVILERDYMENLLKVYRNDSSIGGVSGIITNYARPPLRERLLEELFYTGPFRDERLRLYWRAEELRSCEPARIRKVSGCAMSLRQTALNGQWFDSKYRGAGSEDVELSWRISDRWPIVMAPQARLVHLRTQTGPQRENWLLYTVKGQYYLFYKIWNTSLTNRLCFVWLNCGFALLVLGSCLRKCSLAPARAFISGIRDHKQLVLK